MIIYFYSVVPLLFLTTDASSIRDRNFRNDLVPLFGSRLDSSKKDDNSLKVVSNEPFIIQFQMPNSRENTKRGGKEKDTKRKRPTKKRVSKLKPLRKRQRRDLQNPKTDSDRERKSDKLEIVETGQLSDRPENATKNSFNRADILKALSAYAKKIEAKKSKKDVKTLKQNDEKESEMSKTPETNIQRLSSPPVVKMVYPSAPKTDKHLHKYTFKDLMSDRERLEKKIKYIRNMMNLSATDDAVRVRRRSESDRTANKIAKMFLTLSAVNGLHDRLRSKCDDEDDEDNYEEGYGLWDRERESGKGNLGKRSTSTNEERYKVKKWIEHLKNKRSSSKTCPCMANQRDEEGDVFPLEQRLPKNYDHQKGGGSEESSEAYGYVSNSHRDKLSKGSHYRRRMHKAREDQENKLKAYGKGKKLDLNLDDLELYRMKAKQILQNAEEILDKIKEEEEKRLAPPNILMNQLKELTSRIQTDPRNNENDLIRKIQKTLGLSSTSKSPDGTDGNGFIENVKSFILDPYEKAKALTDESTKKLSSYLLRNLGELEEPSEPKEGGDDFGQAEDRGLESLALSGHQSKSKESPEHYEDTVSSMSVSGDENKKVEDCNILSAEQLKKRMEEIRKAQEEKLSGYQESEENSDEFSERTGSKKEEQGENDIVEQSLKEDETGAPLEHKKDELINSSENDKTEKMVKDETVRESIVKDSDKLSEKENPEEAMEHEKGKRPKDEELQEGVLKEIFEKFEEKEKPDAPEVASSLKEVEKGTDNANEEGDFVESIHVKSNPSEEIPEEVVAVTPEKEEERSSRVGSKVDPKSGYDYDGGDAEGSDEKIEAEKPEQPKEDKSDEETVLGDRKQPETEPNSEIDTADNFNKTPDLSTDNADTVGLNDPKTTKEDELQLQKQAEETQEEIKSQTAEENQDILKEAKSEEFLEKIKSNEEEEAEAEKDEKEDTLQLETPLGEHKQEENDSAKENIYEETSGDDKLAKAIVKDEEQEDLSSATLGSENPEEDLVESKTKGSDNKEEQKSTDDSPSGSATSKEFIKEQGQYSDEDGDVVSQKIEKPAEEISSPQEDTAILKEANEEVEDTQFSSEETTPLKATMDNRSDEKDEDVKINEKTLGMSPTSKEKVSEKLESLETSDEASLKSALDKSQESDKDTETNRMTEDDEGSDEETGDKLKSAKPSLDINDEEREGTLKSAKPNFDINDEETEDKLKSAKPSSDINAEETEDKLKSAKPSLDINDEETEDKLKSEKPSLDINDEETEDKLKSEKPNLDINDEETEDKLKSAKPNLDINDEDLETSKEKDGTELVSKERNEENFDKGEEIRLEAMNPTEEKEGAIQDPDNADVDVPRKENSEETLGTERENEDTLSKAPESQDLKNAQDESVEMSSEKLGEMNMQDEKDTTAEGIVKAAVTETDKENFEDENQKADSLSDQKLKMNQKPLKNEEIDKAKEAESDLDDNTLENGDISEEISLKATNNEEKMEEDDDDAVQATLDDKGQETTKRVDDDTTLKSTGELIGDKISGEDTLMENKDDKLADETPLKSTLIDEIADKEKEQHKSERISDDIPLSTTGNEDVVETPLEEIRNNDESLEYEAPLKSTKLDGNEETGNANKNREEDNTLEDDFAEGTDGQNFVKAKNSVDENSSRAANSEELSNNIQDEGETLRATDDLNHPESLRIHNKEDSDETLREVNIPDDFNNQIDGKDEDETPLRSVQFADGMQDELEEGYDNLRQANPLADYREKGDEIVSSEDSPLTGEEPLQQAKLQKNPEEITPENLREFQPSKHPLKTNTLKVPKSIGKIMKDLEGPEKDDITKLENLNPEKIDSIIDKIDEVEQQNKVSDGVDCWKECACAEDINTRSRNIGRYEIAKDFLLWMKDLQLNRVLSDD